MHSATMKFIEV